MRYTGFFEVQTETSELVFSRSAGWLEIKAENKKEISFAIGLLLLTVFFCASLLWFGVSQRLSLSKYVFAAAAAAFAFAAAAAAFAFAAATAAATAAAAFAFAAATAVALADNKKWYKICYLFFIILFLLSVLSLAGGLNFLFFVVSGGVAFLLGRFVVVRRKKAVVSAG